MDKQWSVFFEKHGDPDSPFARVNPHTALTVVEKYVKLNNKIRIRIK